ncbi:hypothetical protein [Leisingera sp. S232]|uniref:hypothetical protein n=1 Tax=Leisingera sp. S232 TaxID=3415132 RepID=UPI003C798EBD
MFGQSGSDIFVPQRVAVSGAGVKRLEVRGSASFATFDFVDGQNVQGSLRAGQAERSQLRKNAVLQGAKPREVDTFLLRLQISGGEIRCIHLLKLFPAKTLLSAALKMPLKPSLKRLSFHQYRPQSGD